jgi:tetratricopeptide (TPR) repeat protein
LFLANQKLITAFTSFRKKHRMSDVEYLLLEILRRLIGDEKVEVLQLVCLKRLSEEREKYGWEDRDSCPWDQIIGRMYLLKAHDTFEEEHYVDALAYFEQALVLLAKDGVSQGTSIVALADKALVQCFLEQYETALATIEQALAVADQCHPYDQDIMLNNRGSILVLVGAFSDALNVLSTQLDKDPKNDFLRFTLATCLLHLERYEDAIAAYDQAITECSRLGDEGLVAARLGKQPNWPNLPKIGLW